MIDLTTILNEFETFSINHNQIGSYGYGPLNQLQTADRNFPIVWIVSKPGKMFDNYMDLNFDIYILTSQSQNHSNLKSTMNDMLYLGRDMMNNFKDSDITKSFEYEEDVTFGPITFDFDDVIGGWDFDVKITIPLNDGCNLPID